MSDKQLRLEGVIIAGMETQGRRVLSRQQVKQFIRDAQKEYGLTNAECAESLNTIMTWQHKRIASRAGH